MTLDRSKFKGNSFSTIDKEKERAENALPKFGSGDGRAGFHQIKDGKNYRRIAPAHDPADPAYRAKSTIFLECEVPEIDDDGKETGKVEIKNKPLFIATQHSTLGADPILMYIDAVQRRANDEFTDKEERAKFMFPINGWKGRDGKWNWGIKPDIKYVCYSWDETNTLGREELWPGWLDDMKKISIERSSDTNEIIPDIFTDPDEGYPLIISKIKNDKKGKFEYSVGCDLPSATTRESWADFFDRTRVSDEQLVELMSKESLKELYWDVYTTRDFDMALDGLRRFDKKHNFHIFENEEFLEAISDLRMRVKPYVPKSEQEQAPATKSAPVKAQPTKEDVSKNLGVKVSETPNPTSIVPIPKMKNFIKEYIKENYGEDFSLPETLSKEELKQWYELSVAGEELPLEEPEVSNINEEPMETEVKHEPKSEANVEQFLKKEEKPVVTANPGIDPALQSKIAALRAKRNDNK